MTSRRAILDDLVPFGGDRDEVRKLVNQLADKRLLVTDSSGDGSVEAEVAHEALIRHWPRLQGWLSNDAEALHVRDGMGYAARDWARNGKKDDS